MVTIIAEAGTNHGGNVLVAKELVQAASSASADVVKFQMLYAEGLYVPGTWENNNYVESEVFSIRKQQELDEGQWGEVLSEAREHNIPLTFSIFDERGLAFQERISPPFIKIASSDVSNIPFLRKVASTGHKILLATGMATLGEVERAVIAITEEGNHDLVLMHCISVYPSMTEEMNLGFIDVLQSAFGFPVGLSDHTEDSLAAVVAVAKGVKWVEKHLTLDRTAQGFDHAYAMEPSMFAKYVQDIRMIEKASIPRVPKVSRAELLTRKRARRSLYAARDLAHGEKIALSDVLVVRPEGPLQPMDLAGLVGRKLKRDVKKHEALTWDLF